MNEKIIKKNTEPSMQLGPSASFFGKLNQHMNDCHAAERHLNDKLNENDFSWMPLLSSQAEELWKKFQEEYTVVQEPSSFNLQVVLGVSNVSRYLMLTYYPANQIVEPYIAYLTEPSDWYYGEIGDYVASDVEFSAISRERGFVYGQRRRKELEDKFTDSFLAIKWGVINCLKKTLNETFFKNTLKPKTVGKYELLLDITIKNLKTDDWDKPKNVLFVPTLTKIEED